MKQLIYKIPVLISGKVLTMENKGQCQLIAVAVTLLRKGKDDVGHACTTLFDQEHGRGNGCNVPEQIKDTAVKITKKVTKRQILMWEKQSASIFFGIAGEVGSFG